MRKLNEINNLPQMANTLSDWFMPIKLIKIMNRLVGSDIVSSKIYIKFKGVIQPLTEEEVSIKPEEQRSWAWLQIICPANIQLKIDPMGKTGDKILWQNYEYRVRAKKDYSIYGYVEYHLVQDYLYEQ